jgi:CheY-like chemotaxis protein
MAGSPSKSIPVVLIVEDNPLPRMLAVEVIEEAGFVALEVADADEAVALLESRLHIFLLFTGVNILGSMDGLKLAHPRATLATHKTPVGFRTRPAAALLASVEQLLLYRETISGSGNNRAIALYCQFRVIETHSRLLET